MTVSTNPGATSFSPPRPATLKTFERLLATENADINEIVAGILHLQARTARAQHRQLARGTHTKGVSVRGTFEVFDLDRTIADPVLRRRLKQGLFAKPGVYDAVVRFANADTKFASDEIKDVRALSFSVVGPDGVRQDYSMNAATTFPMNDSHAFAIFVRLMEADGFWNKVKVWWNFTWAERRTFLYIAYEGQFVQKRHSVKPYQRFRFWSNTAFRHGPDEAIKYSATASPKNPALEPKPGYDMLRDELVRHVELDESLSCFDFSIQLLDADRMTYRFRKRDEIFWVENAAVEWPEKQAPFHVVGRLRLVGGSTLSEEEARNSYIDVTEHSTIDSQPLGSLNRARWHAEKASREMRLLAGDSATRRLGVLAVSAESPNAESPAVPAESPNAESPVVAIRDTPGAPLPPLPPSRGSWVGTAAKGTIAALLLVFWLMPWSLGLLLHSKAESQMLPPQPAARVDYAAQGWGPGVDDTLRQRFYYSPQGASFKNVRYRWMVNLETPWSKQRLADESIMRRYGFLIDAVTHRNPDRLPVGFTKHVDPARGQEMLDLTCAACHTGQIEITTKDGQTRALRIDGGQADHALTSHKLGSFATTLTFSMITTALNPFKFVRFERRVLGPGYKGNAFQLWRELASAAGDFLNAGMTELRVRGGLSPTEEGYGRTDALARIGNTVFGDHIPSLGDTNYAVGDAPVNFPAVWNMWKFDWVQYNASVSQPMARNIGEALGVGARYELVASNGKPLPDSARFRASVLVKSLDTIENTLRALQSPTWPEAILGRIDSAKAARGEALFEENCRGCHGPYLASDALKALNSPLKAKGQPEWIMVALCADDIATDPNTARNFATTTVDISPTGVTNDDVRSLIFSTDSAWWYREEAYFKEERTRLAALMAGGDSPLRDSAQRERRAIDSIAAMDSSAGYRGGKAPWRNALDVKRLPMGVALSYVGERIKQKAYAAASIDSRMAPVYDGFAELDRPMILDAYKAHPLSGVWATPPYLHNGSVPTIYDMISAPESRPKKFPVGSREYDPVKLGLATDVKGYPIFDTSLPGNHNTGHEFGDGYIKGSHVQPRRGLIGRKLSEEEKFAILEYLKTRNDDQGGIVPTFAPRLPGKC